MGQTGFCKNLRFVALLLLPKSAVSCCFLQQCALPKCCTSQESEIQRKKKKLRIWLRLSFLVPHELKHQLCNAWFSSTDCQLWPLLVVACACSGLALVTPGHGNQSFRPIYSRFPPVAGQGQQHELLELPGIPLERE